MRCWSSQLGLLTFVSARRPGSLRAFSAQVPGNSHSSKYNQRKTASSSIEQNRTASSGIEWHRAASSGIERNRAESSGIEQHRAASSKVILQEFQIEQRLFSIEQHRATSSGIERNRAASSSIEEHGNQGLSGKMQAEELEGNESKYIYVSTLLRACLDVLGPFGI